MTLPRDTQNPALVVVDLQYGFVNESSAHVVPVIVELVRRWQEAGGHVVFTRYHNYPGSPFERLIGWYRLHGSPETDLVAEIVPFLDHQRAHIIDKTTYSSFTSEAHVLFAGQKFTDLMICGISTDSCVLKTVMDAFDGGYIPWVLSDACASNATSIDPAMAHRAALTLMSRLVGASQIIGSNEALARLPLPAWSPAQR